LKTQKLYFLTYGTKNFDISAKHITKLAEKSNFFEKCIYMKPNDIDYNFKKKYEPIFSSPRGAGFWIWKHKIIKDCLDSIGDGDIVVYSDSGSSFNYSAKKRFYQYIEMLNDSEYSNFRIECEKQHIERDWTTKQLFEYFNIDPYSTIGESTQFEATQMIFIKSKETIEYFNDFSRVVDYDMFLISDMYNDVNQLDSFKENRHDQSIFSLLSKTRGCVSVENETHFSFKQEEQYSYPFLSVRTYGHGIKDKLKFRFNHKKYELPVFFE